MASVGSYAELKQNTTNWKRHWGCVEFCSFWTCFFSRSGVCHEDFSFSCWRAWQQRGLSSSAQSNPRLDLLPRVWFPSAFCSQQREVTFSIPGSWAEHDQGLVNSLPSVIPISLSFGKKHSCLTQIFSLSLAPGFSWIQRTCHSVHGGQAAAFDPNISRSQGTLLSFSCWKPIYCILTFFHLYKKLKHFFSEIFPAELSLRSSNASNVHVNG